MGKRSPILGYNHNVRYRGLVFHVQTEDSGVATPHLFTHMFHHGVIVSTRKLDYDAGSAEESIKALMQAQHKAVLRDLRRGQFDDKIDSYLGGTPGLLPRGVEESADRASEAELAPSAGTVEDLSGSVPTEQVLPMMLDDLSAPVVAEKTPPPVRSSSPAIPPPVPLRATGAAASGPTATAMSARPARGNGVARDTTLPTAAPAFEIPPDSGVSAEAEIEAEIEIELVEDGDPAPARPQRQTHDTETHAPVIDPTRPTLNMELDETRPTLGFDDHSRPTLGMTAEDVKRAAALSDGIPAARQSSSATPPPLPSDSRRLGDRPSTINAATLPPARPISRPPSRPALTPPQVVSRPLTPEERSRREAEGIEVYSPAPPSAELPAGERPGQYAQHKKVSQRIPAEVPKPERSGSTPVPIPAGLGRPVRAGSAPNAVKQGTPVPSPSPREASPRGGPQTEPLRGRAPTPARLPVTSRSGATAGSGVVMTRPAVIVGAPAKTVGTVPRIRKAREDEGRGFGQGLISEKSLDEVILAYLSEDADEK